MPLFDRYIVVDWSASNTPKSGKDSIWSCVGHRATAQLETSNHRTRRGAEAWLLQQLTAAVGVGERILVGLDFPYGYPAEFAALLGLAGEPWNGVWAFLSDQVRDDANNVSNRFEVAAEINRRLGIHAPFWGRPEHTILADLPFRKKVVYRGPQETGGLAEWRQVEDQLHRQRSWPQPVWKLAGAGAVGGQTLVGIPVVHRLRNHDTLRGVSSVWPFEMLLPDLPAGVPAVVYAEIWPSIVRFANEVGSCRDEQQVRAVVRHWQRLDETDRFAALFAEAPDTAAVRREEGWILGVPSRGPSLLPLSPTGASRH